MATDGALTAGDTDYFRVVVGAGTLLVYTSGNTNTEGLLEDPTDVAFGYFGFDEGEGFNFRIEESVSAGTYCVRVTGFAHAVTGPYTLHLHLDASPPSDDHGDTCAAATALNLGPNIEVEADGELTAGDTDYFRVTVDQTGTLLVHTSGSTDTFGRMEDSSGTELSRDDNGGAGSNFRIERSVSAGTYCVPVTGTGGSTGDYTLHVLFASGPADDHGDTCADATALDLGPNGEVEIDGELTSGDTDYFRITVGYSRLRVYTTGNTDTVGRVEGVGGVELFRDDNGGDGSNFRIQKTIFAGTWCIAVTGAGGSTGDYTLHVRSSSYSIVRDDHGDTCAAATTIAPNSSRSGELTSGDTDYFRVTVDQSGTLHAYTTGSTDTVGRLEDASGSELSRDDDEGTGSNFRIEQDVTPGTYCVSVGGWRYRALHLAHELHGTGTTRPTWRSAGQHYLVRRRRPGPLRDESMRPDTWLW